MSTHVNTLLHYFLQGKERPMPDEDDQALLEAVKWAAVRKDDASPNGVPKKRRRWGWFRRRRRRAQPRVRPLSVSGGRHAYSGAPFHLPEEFFSIGSLVEGSPGTGKTVAALTAFEQRIRLAKHYPRSFVYLDLKADINSSEPFHVLRLAAEAAGIPFKWVVIGDSALNRPTFDCNPLTMDFWRRADLDTRANFLVAALGLEYGMDYGPHYFGSMISFLADYVLKRFPDACTFRQLYRAVSQLISAPSKQRPRDLHREYIDKALIFHSVLSHLSRFDCLNAAPDSGHPFDVIDARIDFADLQRTPQVVYVFVPKAIGGSAVAEAGRLVPFELQFSSQLCPRHVPVTLAIDEVATIASYPLKDGLNQLRGMDVGLIYILQSQEDLKTTAVDLRPNVKNLPVHWQFSIDSPDKQKEFVENSGLTSELHGSMTGRPTIGGLFAYESFTLREELVPFHNLNIVKAVSADPELSFVSIKRDVPDCRYNGLSLIVRRMHRQLGEYALMPWPHVTGSFVPARRAPEHAPEQLDFAGPVPPLSVNAKHDRQSEVR